ncbi:MAG: non-ribosomal peptide synthetase, partial [Acidobacteria bacterium]
MIPKTVSSKRAEDSLISKYLPDKYTPLKSLLDLRGAPRPANIPASHAQRRLWFIDQLNGSSTEYNIMIALRIRGTLNVAALERAVQLIVARHEALRTVFSQVNGEPIQIIRPDGAVIIRHEDLREMPEARRREYFQAVLERESDAKFNLEEGPLLQLCLLRTAAAEHVLVRTVHHIISDGWSEGNFNRELFLLYDACCFKRENPLPPLPLQYADFAIWHNKSLEEGASRDGLDYWMRQLADIPERLELPADRPRQAVQTWDGGILYTKLTLEDVTALRRLGMAYRMTPYMMLLAAFSVLLSRHTGQTDIVIGSPIANRLEPELEPLIGFFVNTLLMRVRLDGRASLAQLLRQTRETTLAAYQHQDVPFETIVEGLSPQRVVRATPLIQVWFALQNAPFTTPQLADLVVESVPASQVKLRFELELHAVERGDMVELCWLYSRALFDEWRVRQWAAEFGQIVRALTTSAPQTSVTSALFVQTRPTTTDGDFHDIAPRTIPDLLEAQANETPDRIAVICDDKHISYRTFDVRASLLAQHLNDCRIGADDTVGIGLDRSIEMLVTIAGVLKAGATYLPLDLSQPKLRLWQMVDDARAVMVVYIACRMTMSGGVEDQRAASVRPDNTAYVIYTSGSTGTPKGVPNTHRGLLNRLLWMQHRFNLTESDVVLQKTPLTFDVSVWECLWALLCGARIVLAAPGRHLETDYLADTIKRFEITTVHFVPSALTAFLDDSSAHDLATLRRIVCSGESLSAALHERVSVAVPAARLENLYGPTEASIDVTAWASEPLRRGETPPIGKPIWNTRVYVLDREGELA